jgi:2-amino-4-hydroxy-6-hydroxymethyldihydropteridine diphosphokinase
MHTATILLGSNINPEKNINKAIHRLLQEFKFLKSSQIWDTEAIESDGPDFLNTAIVIETSFLENELKYKVLRKIEKELGRVREENKSAPRTIDLDIILFDDQVVDQDLWNRSFIASPISELFPDLQQPSNKRTLLQVAKKLRSSAFARIHKQTIDPY